MPMVLAAVLMLFIGGPACADGLGAPAGPAFAHTATELLVNGGMQQSVIPAHPAGQALYLLAVQPGTSYTLGLHFPSGQQKVRVRLYDRWPSAPGAKEIRLPMGPVVKTNPNGLRYYWRFSISPESTGSDLYITVEAAAPAGFPEPVPYALFITSPPLIPSQIVGQGITFLQGPRNFRLVGEETLWVYAVERTEPPAEAERQFPLLPLPGDLIKNGTFGEGLNHWQPRREGKAVDSLHTLSVQPEGLHLYSASEHGREGIRQEMHHHVSGAASLVLRAEIKVTRQTQGGTGQAGRQAPVLISVGYLDAEGQEHRGSGAYQAAFYLWESDSHQKGRHGQQVEKDRWVRFQTDLLQLEPEPKIITYIDIEGVGGPEREGWVREVHLLQQGGAP